jgi:predicted RNase H-like nuclease (RuvC/YqgF family)
VQFLKAEIKKISFEKGELLSEIEEHKHEVKLLKKEISELKISHNRKKQGFESKIIGLERHISKMQFSLYEQRKDKMST